jgi:hypothetical protein
MRIFWNDKGMAIVPFRISLPPTGIVNLAGSTVLARATVGVPYSYQLRAEGGVAPYRWSLVGNPPPGLTLSPAGVFSGSPARRGSFRIAVRADDASGNTVSRTLGLGVGETSPGSRVTGRVLTKLPASPDACATRPENTDFSTRDLGAWLAFAVESPAEDLGRIEWLNPYGEVSVSSFINRRLDSRRCFEVSLPIAGANGAALPGNWRVRVFLREAEVMSVPFRISDGSQPAVQPGRRALVVGNGAYKNLSAIPSAAAESTAVAEALRQDGFDVMALQDLSLDQWHTAEREFIGKTQKGDVVLAYFTGYGVQRNGDNWLLGANFNPSDNLPLTAKAYSVLRLRQLLEDKEVRIAVLVLDAARQDPAIAAAGQGAGLARMDADGHTVLVYAVPPGRGEKTPADARIGTFAQAFIKAIQTPAVGIQQLLLADLPKAVTSLAADRPAPVSLVQTSEEFVFRAAAASTAPLDLNDSPAGNRLNGQWEFGRAESTLPNLPAGRLCTLTLSRNRGKFGNTITGKAGNCNGPEETFWRLERDRLHIVGGAGFVTSVLLRVSDDEWKGNSIRTGGVVYYLKRVAPPADAKKNP